MTDRIRDRLFSAFRTNRYRPQSVTVSPDDRQPPEIAPTRQSDSPTPETHLCATTPEVAPTRQSDSLTQEPRLCSTTPDLGEGSRPYSREHTTIAQSQGPSVSLEEASSKWTPNRPMTSSPVNCGVDLLAATQTVDAREEPEGGQQQPSDSLRVASLDKKIGKKSTPDQVQKSSAEGEAETPSGSVPHLDSTDKPLSQLVLQDSDDSPDQTESFHRRDTTPQAGTSFPCANKQLKFLLPVEGKRKTPSPFAAMAIDSLSSDCSKLSPLPPPTDSLRYEDEESADCHHCHYHQGEDEMENSAEDCEKEERGERHKNNLIGDDGLLNVFALRHDLNKRFSGLNKRFLKYRLRQETIRRLLTYIQHLMKETESMNSLLALATDQIGLLAKEASDRRDELANVCDFAVTVATVGKSDSQMQKLEPSCYKRYLNIRNSPDCINLLATVRNKKKALNDLEILIHRKRLIQQNGLPVTINDDTPAKSTTATKKPHKLAGRGGLKGSKFNKMQFSKGSGFKAIVLEVIASPLDDSGSIIVSPEEPTTPASSDTPLSTASTVQSTSTPEDISISRRSQQ